MIIDGVVQCLLMAKYIANIVEALKLIPDYGYNRFFLSNLRRPIKLVFNSPTHLSGSGGCGITVVLWYHLRGAGR